MANKYYVGSGNWSTAANWRTTSGGSTATTIPTTADTAYLDSYSGDVVVDTTAATAGNINCTNFTGSLTIDGANILTIVTSVTLGAGMTPVGNGALKVSSGSGTLTSAGLTIPWAFYLTSATGKKTLADIWYLGNGLYQAAHATVNGNKFVVVSGGWQSKTTSTYNLYGTVEVWLQGGTWLRTIKRTGGKVVIDGYITSSGGTSGSGSNGVYDSTIQYNSGSPVFTGALNVTGTSTFVGMSAVIFDDIDGAGTLTIDSDIYIAGSIQCAGTTTLTFVGAYSVYVGEHVIMYNAGTFISSTTKIVMNGTGMLFRRTSLNGMGYSGTNPLQIDVEINTTGTISFETSSGYVCKWGNGRTLTYTAGTVTMTNVRWDVPTGHTYNFDIDVTVPYFTVEGTANLLSDFGTTSHTQTAGSAVTIADTKIFTISTSLHMYGTTTAATMSSNGTGVLTYGGTKANCKVAFSNFTNIDASTSEVPIFSWHGTVTNCTNIRGVSADNIKTMAYASM